MIGTKITEEITFDKIIENVEKLGKRWLQEHIKPMGRTIVANSLLLAKISYRAMVNGITQKYRQKIKHTFRKFMWGGKSGGARVKWEQWEPDPSLPF